MKPLRIALIGSRALHEQGINEEDIKLLHKVCYRLATLGITFRSGLCNKGMDAIAQIEYSRALSERKAFESQFEVYVWDIKAIHKSQLPNKHLALVRNATLKHETEKIASTLHSNWEACSDYAKAQHARNVHQILGYHLNEPVDAVITWGVLDNYGKPIGGTGTALRLAEQRRIPIFNLYNCPHDVFLSQVTNFLRSQRVRGLKGQ